MASSRGIHFSYGKSNTKVPANVAPDGNPVPACKQPPSCCALTWPGRGSYLVSSSYKGTKALRGADFMTTSKPNYLPKVPPPNTVTGVNGFTYESVDRNINIHSTIASKTELGLWGGGSPAVRNHRIVLVGLSITSAVNHLKGTHLY